jgi:hypothetical protein
VGHLFTCRASLSLHGENVPLTLLEGVELEIATIDANQTKSSTTVRDFQLRELPFAACHMLRTPPRCSSVEVFLRASVEHTMRGANGKKEIQKFTTTMTMSVDSTQATCVIHDVFMTALPSGEYALQALGRLGEPIHGLQLQLELTHWAWQRTLMFACSTGGDGLCSLGTLDGITHVSVCVVRVHLPGSRAWDHDGCVQFQWVLQGRWTIAGDTHAEQTSDQVQCQHREPHIQRQTSLTKPDILHKTSACG